MTTVVGFDGSLSSSGLAVWRDGRWSFDTIRTGPQTPLERRWSTITARLRHATTPGALVVIESVFRGGQGHAATDLAMLHGIVRHRLHVWAVPYALVQTQHLKQFATGRGNATKEQMVAAARDRLGLPLSSDDQADAAWLAAMALHRYGLPLCPATALQDAVAAGVRWPQWNPDVTPLHHTERSTTA